MDQQTLQTLAVLLALGAGFVAPVKAATDIVKRTLPEMPAWGVLLTALVLGEVTVTLVSVYGGLSPTPQNVAGLLLAGAVAAGGAVATTEIARSARAPAVPTVSEIADELEARNAERQADQAPGWLAQAPTVTTGSAPTMESLYNERPGRGMP